MRRPLAFLFVSAGSLSLVVACGSSSDSPARGFVRQYCELLVPCCVNNPTGSGSSSTGGPPGSGCQDVYGLFTLGANYDAVKGDGCLGEIRAHNSEPTFCSQVSVVAPSCDKVFTSPGGTKQPGETCTKTPDCALSPEGKVECGSASASGAGSTCQLVIDGKEGDAPCVGTKIGAVTTTIGPSTQPARGYTCDTQKQLYCSKAGACAPTKAVGDACTTSESYVCGAGTCSGSPSTCVARPPPTSSSNDISLLFVCASKS